jgi:putative heme-binding domain-containing protein
MPLEGRAEFNLRFRRKSATANNERLIAAALSRAGNAERGRALFLDAEKSQCLKCHRLGERGERIGPELTGIGSRFSRIHLAESIIEPSRAIAPSYESLVIELSDGRLVTGVRVAETEKMFTIADNQGVQHVITKSDIAAETRSPQSTMPTNFAERLTEEEFVDLISFLAGEKER